MLGNLRRLQSAFLFLRYSQRRWLSSVGLFKNKSLQSPEDFGLLSQDVHAECKQLCDEVRSLHRTRKMMEIFDEMSNKICSVADMVCCSKALLSRNIDRRVSTTFIALNTSSELYTVFRGSALNGDVQDLDEIDRLVSNLLLRDFETSGVHLPEQQRRKFVALSAEAFSCGADFVRRSGDDMLALDSALFDSSDPEIRRLGYKLYYRCSDYQEERLLRLLQCRAEIASLAGYNSYADRALQQMLLRNGKEVSTFLEAVLDSVRDRSMRDIEILEGYGRNIKGKTHVWDWPYLSFVARRSMYNLQTADIMVYLRLDRFISNLSELLKELYGISIYTEQTEPGEVWHDTVTKWLIEDEQHSTLGYIYCDWYDREGKIGDSHFTIQCGKQLADGGYQLPVVVLSFRLAPQKPEETYLTHSQLQNVLHEIGHALHSLFGRTRYQHVSGTRCSTDFAEVPSNLMEQWAYDAKVCRLTFMLSALTLMPDGSTFGALELAQQALMALADLRLHQERALDHVNTVQLCHALYADAGFADWMPHGTAWLHRFSHIVPYGSKYSSYLVARAVALLYWHRCFERDPTNRAAGMKWRCLQSYGGERNPADLLGEAIDYIPTPKDLAEVLLQDLPTEQ
ncbi:Peptidase M3 domain containing protein [Trichuris trichiura]|uniref:Peptidase M3 domain containing protein n=1 Tax=Trichuris trichiura TaxID=36087 RepID=A0A077Z2A6_TRITR|nr:Peptidase M3 domain containing protein [Trichuris trichiura]